MEDLWFDVQESFGHNCYRYPKYHFPSIGEWLLDKFFSIVLLPAFMFYGMFIVASWFFSKIYFFFRNWIMGIVDNVRYQPMCWIMLVGICMLCGCVFGVPGVFVGGFMGVLLSGLLHLANQEGTDVGYKSYTPTNQSTYDGGFLNFGNTGYYGTATSNTVTYAKPIILKERYHTSCSAPREDDMRRDRQKKPVTSTLWKPVNSDKRSAYIDGSSWE